MKPSRRRFLKRLALGALAALALGALVFAALWIAFPFPAERLGEATGGGSALVLDREGKILAWRVDGGGRWRLPVRIAEVSPWLARATVAAEDKRFYSHAGVDPAAAARAFGQNLAGGRRVSGASTVTMQDIRLLWKRPRTWPAKAVESFRALQIEQLADKPRIMELYLSLAPYGGNAVGAEAAARLYFGKGAAELSLGEAALLAGIPQSPARFNPRRRLDAALSRREYVFGRMRELGLATESEVAAARREPIAIAGRPEDAAAGAFADWVMARLGPQGGPARTTLDAETQSAARAAALRHAAELRKFGINGLAIVVVDVQSSELLAMVGRAEPDDPQVGQVNGATGPRQPGSLLKPFIYARAFDAGALTPDAVVYDLPCAWRDYRPENFDRACRGPMSAARALRESRNLPAVRLLAALGQPALVRDMDQLGISPSGPPERYGLSLALGSAEVRLLDVAGAYAALARLGEWRPLRALANEPPGEPRRVYSPGSAYLTLRCLGAAGDGQPPTPAWKTGTSWNYRDAWAVAMTPSRVVAVWCGKPAGGGHPALLGARTALPVALELAADLGGRETWARPETVRVRRACAVSGALATAGCERAIDAQYLPGVSSEAPCALHRHVNGRVVEVWPAEAAAWLAANGAGGESAPPVPALQIASPRSGAEYVLPRGEAAKGSLPLALRPLAGRHTVFWFVDGQLWRNAEAGEAVEWPLSPGRHEVLACDASGASARASFTVSR